MTKKQEWMITCDEEDDVDEQDVGAREEERKNERKRDDVSVISS